MGVALALALSSQAIAAPSSQDKATAKAAWNKGKKLAAQKKYEDAIESFRIADGLDPKTQYKLDLARALADTGKLVEASDLCDEIAGMEEPSSKQQKQAAEKLAEKLAPRLPHLRVEVSGPARAIVKVDGEEVPAGKDLKRDPGTHSVKAEADGYRAATKDVTLTEGQKATVELSLAAEVVMAKGDEGGKKSGGTMVPAGIAFGIGAAGIGVGTVFGILAFKATGDVQSHCKGNVCPPSEAGNIVTAKTDGNVSTAGFVIGGVGLAAGLVLALTVGRGSGSSDEKKDKDRTVTLVPSIGPGTVGVAGTF